MHSKIIFFSIDRLGDYLIRSNIIKCVSDKFIKKEIICSEINHKLVSKQSFFTKTYIFNRKTKFTKFFFIKNFFLKKYDSAICFDGKNISNIILFIIRAKFKFTFIYKKKGFVNNFFFYIYCFFLKLCKINFAILNSREIIESGFNDHYPSRYKILNKIYNNDSHQPYYVEDLDKDSKQINLSNFILIHLDEKFEDIEDIDNLNIALKDFSKQTSRCIIVTSFNNKCKYYENLTIPKINYKNLNTELLNNNKIIILENLCLENFYELLKKSHINISCHAGFMTHISLYFKKNCIDILNQKDERWINTWTTPNKNYKIILKSTPFKKYSIKEIFIMIKKLNYEI